MGKKSKRSKIKADKPEQATSAEGLVGSSGPASGSPDGDAAESAKAQDEAQGVRGRDADPAG